MRQWIVLADTPWLAVPTRTQQLVTRLKDAEVLFLEPPEASRRWKEPGRQVRPNVTVHTRPPLPPLPTDAPDFFYRRAWRKQADYIAKTAARHRFRDPVLWCTDPEQVLLLDHLSFRGLVYDCAQDWSFLPPDLEGSLAANADVVFAASPWLVERLLPCNPNVTLLPHGVNFPMFCRSDLDLPPELEHILGPVLGFAGSITPDLDLSPLVYTARSHPEWTFVLLGEVEDNLLLRDVEVMPNILLLGHRPMVDVPDYLGRFDVCLELRRSRQRMDEVLPRRVYEYLSTGKPIVTLLFPDQVEEFPDVIYGAHSLAEFERMCVSALAEDKTWVAPRRLDYGQAAAWSRRAAEVQRILGAIGLY